MKKLFRLFFLLIIFCFGCKKSIQTPTETTHQSDINIAVNHKPYAKLETTSHEMIKGWKEYYNIDELLKSYENVSPEEAFGNVMELKDMAKALKDSLNIEILKTPAFKSRLNVFENEVLRLTDMADIPAIKSVEVNGQIDKVYLLFGSINNKINTVNSKKRFDDEINLDDFFKLERDSIAKLKNSKHKTKKPQKKVSKTTAKKRAFKKTLE